MNTTYGIAAMLAVWALPVQAERIEDRPAVQNRDAVPLMMSVRLSEADRPVTSGESLHRSVRKQARRIMPRLGPAPKVHLTGEQIAEAVRGAEAGASGEVLIVDCHGNYDHDTIQTAIDAASDGDVIIVLPNTCTEDGHYFENINFLGKGITVQSLEPTNPNIVAATIIGGALNDLSTVTFNSGENGASILDGLTVTGGPGTTLDLFNYEDYDASLPWGGGVLCIQSSPTIRDCRIINNHATHGGGVAVHQGQPSFVRCDISNNLVQPTDLVEGVYWLPFGGGLDLWQGSAVLEDCRIENNLVDVFLKDLVLPGMGAGISLVTFGPGHRELAMRDCVVSGNHINGGVSSPFNGYGGGVLTWGDESEGGTVQFLLRNSMVLDNRAPRGGAGLFFFNGVTATIMGSTVAGNTFDETHGDGLDGANAVVLISNSIIHHNFPADIGHPGGGMDYSFEYSDIGLTINVDVDGPGNTDADPLFADPDNGVYHLTAESPCVDAGDPEFEPEEGETDIDGEPRVVGGRVDMGADEFLITCDGDLDLDGAVGPFDLALLLGDWGPCGDPDDCPPDLDGDGAVGPFDLALLLGNWGPCE